MGKYRAVYLAASLQLMSCAPQTSSPTLAPQGHWPQENRAQPLYAQSSVGETSYPRTYSPHAPEPIPSKDSLPAALRRDLEATAKHVLAGLGGKDRKNAMMLVSAGLSRSSVVTKMSVNVQCDDLPEQVFVLTENSTVELPISGQHWACTATAMGWAAVSIECAYGPATSIAQVSCDVGPAPYRDWTTTAGLAVVTGGNTDNVSMCGVDATCRTIFSGQW